MATSSLSSAVVCDKVLSEGVDSLASSTARPARSSRTVPSISCSGKLLTVTQAARILGIHENTLRAWSDTGYIECLVLPSGHRRFSQAMLDRFNGIEGDMVQDDARRPAAYTRLSSQGQNGQNKDGERSIDRQKGRLLDRIMEIEGVKEDDIRVYQDICSSFGERPSLDRLLFDVIDGKVSKIYVTVIDRLARIPGQLHSITSICKRYGVEIVEIDQEEEQSEQEIFQQELLNFILVFCNKMSARKSAQRTTKSIKPETMERVIGLRKRGLSIVQCAEILNEEGHMVVDGMGRETPINHNKLRRILASGDNLTKVYGDGGKVESSIDIFIRERVEKTGDDQHKLTVNSLYPAYQRFCEQKGYYLLPSMRIGREIIRILGRENGVVVRNKATFVGYNVRA